MQKFGFFNAKMQAGEPDRKYNANDYSDNLAVIISNGVLRSENDDLKVTADGMNVTVAAGRAWINGHYYKNTSDYDFPAVTAPISGSRYDRVMLRLNNDINARSILLTYVQGVASSTPEPPAPVRNADIYDIVLANVYVGANESSVVIEDQRDNSEVCGWVYSTAGDNSFFTSLDESFYEWFTARKDELSSVTLFKRYTWETTLQAAGSTVTFNIPQYDSDTCFIEVFVNGILENQNTGYTLSGTTITFDGLLIVGTKVTVKCYKSIDGTGINTVADEITELQNRVAQIEGSAKFVYKCNGENDNISLSQIAQAIYSGSYDPEYTTENANAFLSGLDDFYFSTVIDRQIEIEVTGYCDATVPYTGEGTSANPYKWFYLGANVPVGTRIIWNFSKCSVISVGNSELLNTANNIFYGCDLYVKNANVSFISLQNGVSVQVVRCPANTGRVYFDNCKFVAEVRGSALIAEHGTFTNCYGRVQSTESTAYCFKPRNTGLIKVNSGEYYAYGGENSGIGSAIFHTSAGDTDAVVLAYNLHCPVVTVTYYAQGFLSVANAGNTIINGVVSRLTSSGSYNAITNLVNKNKA